MASAAWDITSVECKSFGKIDSFDETSLTVLYVLHFETSLPDNSSEHGLSTLVEDVGTSSWLVDSLSFHYSSTGHKNGPLSASWRERGDSPAYFPASFKTLTEVRTEPAQSPPDLLRQFPLQIFTKSCREWNNLHRYILHVTACHTYLCVYFHFNFEYKYSWTDERGFVHSTDFISAWLDSIIRMYRQVLHLHLCTIPTLWVRTLAGLFILKNRKTESLYTLRWWSSATRSIFLWTALVLPSAWRVLCLKDARQCLMSIVEKMKEQQQNVEGTFKRCAARWSWVWETFGGQVVMTKQ